MLGRLLVVFLVAVQGACGSGGGTADRNRSSPQGLAWGAGGVLWLTESRANKIARIRGGKVQEVYQAGQWPDHIAITADGFGWFTEYYQDRLGRVMLPAS